MIPRFPERTLAELMTSTRRRLAEEVIKLREQASHPYITQLEQENAALREQASHPYITQLEQENAALREIVQALAEGACDYREHDWPEVWMCAFCQGESRTGSIKDKEVTHAEACLVTKARALLAHP